MSESDNEKCIAYFVMVDGFWEYWTDSKEDAEKHKSEKEIQYPRCEWTIEEYPMTRYEYNRIVMV